MGLEVMRGCNLGARVEMVQEIGEEDACRFLQVPCGPMGEELAAGTEVRVSG